MVWLHFPSSFAGMGETVLDKLTVAVNVSPVVSESLVIKILTCIGG